MNIYDEAEKELAGLLGLEYNDGMAHVVVTPTWKTTEGGGPKGIVDAKGFRTNPATDDRDAFDLMVTHRVYPQHSNNEGHDPYVFVRWSRDRTEIAFYKDHTTEQATWRYAIVLGVIAKLKEVKNATNQD